MRGWVGFTIICFCVVVETKVISVPCCQISDFYNALKKVHANDELVLGSGQFGGVCQSAAAITANLTIVGNDTVLNCRSKSSTPLLTISGGDFAVSNIEFDGMGLYICGTVFATIDQTVFKNVPVSAVCVDRGTHGQLSISNSMFHHNTASNGVPGQCGLKVGGGAIYVQGGAVPLVISDSLFDGNEVQGDDQMLGGGAILTNSDVHITNTTFFHNQGTVKAGALFLCGSVNTIINSHFDVNSVFTKNATEEGSASGGAVYVHKTAANFSDCVFRANQAEAYGGALTFHQSPPSNVQGCLFTNNGANLGGALALESAHATTISVRDTIFQGNTASSYGGGFYITTGIVTLDTVLFLNNTAQDGGGAVYSDVATGTALNISSSRFEANSLSGGGGGGIFIAQGAMHIDATEFLGNEAGSGPSTSGGAIQSNGAMLTIVGPTSFVGNSAGQGGAVYVAGATAYMMGASFTGNEAVNGGALFVTKTEAMTVVSTSFLFNSASTGGGAVFTSMGALDLSDATFVNNTASMAGALECQHGTLSMNNISASLQGVTPGQWAFMCGSCGCCPSISHVLGACVPSPGVSCAVECVPGFALVSSNEITCEVGGNWTDPTPCALVPGPPHPPPPALPAQPLPIAWWVYLAIGGGVLIVCVIVACVASSLRKRTPKKRMPQQVVRREAVGEERPLLRPISDPNMDGSAIN